MSKTCKHGYWDDEECAQCAAGDCAPATCYPLSKDHPLTLNPLNRDDLMAVKGDVMKGKPTAYLATYALCRSLLDNK